MAESEASEAITNTSVCLSKPHSSLLIFVLSIFATAVIFSEPFLYRPALFICLSSLLVTTYTDLQSTAIFDLVNRTGILVALASSAFNLLPTSPLNSTIGALSAFLFFYLIEAGWRFFKKTEGLGSGDKEVLALIGALAGIKGWWYAMAIGSIIGVLYAYSVRLLAKKTVHALPFVPFLTAGTLIVLYAQSVCWL